MAALTGVGVLVTRPEAQAAQLTHLLGSAGARVFHLATLETHARPALASLRAGLGPLDRFHWLIFMSANAVRHGLTLLEGQATPALGVVGPATASALRAAGHAIQLMPAQGYTSEHLLALAPLNAVNGKRILIIRGTDGRDVLGETLAARGAQVTYAEVYERACAVPPTGAVAAMEAAWRAGSIDVVTATSAQVLRCLIEILTPDGRGRARAAPLVVGSERIAREARRMGFEGELILAQSPDSAALLTALTAWRRARGTPVAGA